MTPQIPPRRIAVVLGMHRSGTSVMTRALELMGAGFGDNLLPPVPGVNPKGFFEDMQIIYLNDRLLETVNADWLNSCDTSAIDWPTLIQGEWGDVARRYLETQMSCHPLYCFKDPRTARTLPFWKAIFAQLNVDPIFVIAHRNPMSIAASLENRDKIPPLKSYWLWIEHHLAALQETEGFPRLVVGYERMLADPKREVYRIARLFGVGTPSPEMMEEFERGFLDESLAHSSLEEVPVLDDEAPAVAQKLYVLSHRLARDEISIDSDELKDAIVSIREDLAARGDLIAIMHHQDQELYQLHRLAREGLQHSQEHAQLRHQVAALTAQLRAVSDSPLWRVTEPLRKLKRILRQSNVA
jgi:hypothetical protein